MALLCRIGGPTGAVALVYVVPPPISRFTMRHPRMAHRFDPCSFQIHLFRYACAFGDGGCATCCKYGSKVSSAHKLDDPLQHESVDDDCLPDNDPVLPDVPSFSNTELSVSSGSLWKLRRCARHSRNVYQPLHHLVTSKG